MRGYYEIDSNMNEVQPELRIRNWKDDVINLCRVVSCNQAEHVGKIVQVDDVMRDIIEERGSGRVIDIAGRTVFLYNPVLQSCGQRGGI